MRPSVKPAAHLQFHLRHEVPHLEFLSRLFAKTLGPHVVYLSNIVKRTLTEQMREQSRYLRNHGRARRALKEVVEMPDQQADRALRSIEQNNGEFSNALAK